MALTLRTLAQSRDEIRFLIRDTDTATPSVSDARVNSAFNNAYVQFKAASEDRTYEYDATSLGTTVSAGDLHVLTSDTQVQEIPAMYRATGATSFDGPELERVEIEEIIELQNSDATQAAPTRYAISRYQKQVANASVAGRFYIWLHPIPDDTYYIAAHVRLYVAQLTADSHLPDCTDEEQAAIELEAAANLARIMGHEKAYVDDLRSRIPLRLRAIFSQQERALAPPRLKPSEVRG